MRLHFGRANAKLKELEKVTGKRIATFSLLSGFSCPYAKDCESRAIESNGRRTIQDGKHTLYRCFSASQEALFPPVYATRKANMEILSLAAKSVDDAANALSAAIPKKTGIVRISVGGDFRTQAYFDAWLLVAYRNPSMLFYAYTKSLPFWVRRLADIPSNFILTASYGGYKDSLIEKHGLKNVKVVYSVDEAKKLNLPIDHDDSHAIMPQVNFSLLLHGIQPAKSNASAALEKLAGLGSYSRKQVTK